MDRGARRKRGDSELAVGARGAREIRPLRSAVPLPREPVGPAPDTPATRRRAWRERSMDRVFDEYLKYLKEVPSGEDAARPRRAAANTKRPASAGRALKRYRKATSRSRKREADDLDDEE